MASPQHRTPEHTAAYRALRRANQQRDLICVQPICIMASRVIPQGAPIDVAHDDSGTVILGPAHRRCNRHEAGKKRHRITRRAPSWLM